MSKQFGPRDAPRTDPQRWFCLIALTSFDEPFRLESALR